MRTKNTQVYVMSSLRWQQDVIVGLMRWDVWGKRKSFIGGRFGVECAGKAGQIMILSFKLRGALLLVRLDQMKR
jgi:hypothetical protein